VLTRTVWRSLADGKQIVVRRSYTVRFTRQDNGFRLDGEPLDASVEAPPLLASLAEIERKRVDTGPFPLQLDSSGVIRFDGGTKPAAADSRSAALERGHAMIASSSLAPAQRQEGSAMLDRIAAQGAVSAWPADLFNPASAASEERRRIVLPDGSEGEVQVTVKVLDGRNQGLPQAVERTVTTVLAGTTRTSREQWTLAPVAPANP